MARYTVLWRRSEEDKLADYCIKHFGSGLGAIGRAVNQIDQALGTAPRGGVGFSSQPEVYHFTVAPIRVFYTVDDGDCKVTVWLVTFVGTV
jgi:hypothetical protein